MFQDFRRFYFVIATLNEVACRATVVAVGLWQNITENLVFPIFSQLHRTEA